MTGKYAPLESHLRGIPESQGEVALRFQEIEEILHFSLPASAYEDRRWWDHATEANHVTPRAWTTAGWKIESVDVEARWVKMVRSR